MTLNIAFRLFRGNRKEGLKKSIPSQGYSEDDSYMDLALKVIREFLKQHVIGSPRDQMAIIFYNAVSPFQRRCAITSIATAAYHTHAGCKVRYTNTFFLTPRCYALQRQAKNSSDFPNIHIFHDLEGTTAQRIKEVEMLQGERTSACLTR